MVSVSAQQPSGPAPASGWLWQPSAYAFLAADESGDLPFATPSIAFEEPRLGANLGVSLDGLRAAPRGRVATGLFGLVRSPFTGADRSFFASGRVLGVWQASPHWRFQFGDSAKVQHRPEVAAADFRRNEVNVSADWLAAGGTSMTVAVGDRRRSVPNLSVLGFARQEVGFSVGFPISRRVRVGAGLTAQRYTAETADGRRYVASGEVSRVSPRTILVFRYAWFRPDRDRRRQNTESGPDFSGEFGDVDRAVFFERLALEGSDAAFVGDMFTLDPVESEAEEWDFGRHKQLVAAFLSHRLPVWKASLSASIRFQHRRGPNLLAPANADTAASFIDDRLLTRATLTRELSPRWSVLVQGSMLRNSADRSILDFSRVLVGAGVRVQF